MDESTKRRRAGVSTALVGAVLLALWLFDRVDYLALPGEFTRVFLLVVGAPLLLAGVLVARSGVAPRPQPHA